MFNKKNSSDVQIHFQQKEYRQENGGLQHHCVETSNIKSNVLVNQVDGKSNISRSPGTYKVIQKVI